MLKKMKDNANPDIHFNDMNVRMFQTYISLVIILTLLLLLSSQEAFYHTPQQQQSYFKKI